MRIEEILQLIDKISESELTEFKLEDGNFKLSLKKNNMGNITAGTSSNAVSYAVAPVSEENESTPGREKVDAVLGNIVKSPLVGTFYTASSEDSEPFVKVGDSVKEGQVLAIIEAMKLMNDIDSDFSGKVTEILVENGDAVEYGQPLFVIQ